MKQFKLFHDGIGVRYFNTAIRILTLRQGRGFGIAWESDGGLYGTYITVMFYRAWRIEFVWVHDNQFAKK